MIDQFAAAEGRMKWAPNKRLHFEVAVIKAIQTLNQVTLNEVIENLAALREGGVAAAVSAAGSAPKTQAPRIAEKTPVPTPAPIDPKDAWAKTVEKVRATRRLIAGWVEAGTALGVEGRFFLVGFPPEQKAAMESLSIPKTRDYIDAILKEVSGQDWKLKFVLKEGLPANPPVVTAPPKKTETQATLKDDLLIQEA